MRKFFLCSAFTVFFMLECGLCLRARAQAPRQASATALATYYSKADGKKQAALKTAMYTVISAHENIGYDGLLDAYKESDRRADGYLRDWYSNVTSYVIGGPAETATYKAEGDSYNREHCVPQSWFNKANPMKSDLVHVVPTDGYVNNRRGSFPFGETRGEVYKSAGAYSKVGACTVSGYSGQVFEPNDEIKGDIARIYFYMVTCYENRISGWNGGTASQVFDGKTYPGLKDWTLQMMLRWSKLDPVDDVERARNEVVYKLQKNRNPFVDYPSLCEYVWGDSIAYAFDVTGGHEVNPDDSDPVNPDPDDPDNPDHTDATSGSIDLTRLSWTACSHTTYGEGFTATANGLSISYYKAESPVTPISVGSELRFYDKSILTITGAEVQKVVFYDAGGSKSDASISIADQNYSFQDGKITWTGSMNPFVCRANKQSRISSIDVVVKEADGVDALPDAPSFRLVFDEQGRYLGHSVPPRRGVYLLRDVKDSKKLIIK